MKVIQTNATKPPPPEFSGLVWNGGSGALTLQFDTPVTAGSFIVEQCVASSWTNLNPGGFIWGSVTEAVLDAFGIAPVSGAPTRVTSITGITSVASGLAPASCPDAVAGRVYYSFLWP